MVRISGKKSVEIYERPDNPKQVVIEYGSELMVIDKTKVPNVIKDLVHAANLGFMKVDGVKTLSIKRGAKMLEITKNNHTTWAVQYPSHHEAYLRLIKFNLDGYQEREETDKNKKRV